MNTVEIKEVFFSSLFSSTKDKVLSMRIEESLYKLLEELSKEMETETVSETVRKIISFYLLSAIFEEEWEKINSESFEEFVQEVAEAGDKIEIQKFKRLLQEVSEYLEFLKTLGDKVRNSVYFFEEKTQELGETISKLEQASIIWNEELFNGEKVKM